MASARNKTWYKATSVIIGALLLLFSVGLACHYSSCGMGASFAWLSVGFWSVPTEMQQVPAGLAAPLLIVVQLALSVTVLIQQKTAPASGVRS